MGQLSNPLQSQLNMPNPSQVSMNPNQMGMNLGQLGSISTNPPINNLHVGQINQPNGLVNNAPGMPTHMVIILSSYSARLVVSNTFFHEFVIPHFLAEHANESEQPWRRHEQRLERDDCRTKFTTSAWQQSVLQFNRTTATNCSLCVSSE